MRLHGKLPGFKPLIFSSCFIRFLSHGHGPFFFAFFVGHKGVSGVNGMEHIGKRAEKRASSRASNKVLGASSLEFEGAACGKLRVSAASLSRALHKGLLEGFFHLYAGL